jgi:hypothetical protein
MDDFSKALKNCEAIAYDKALKLGSASREALERRRSIGCDIASNNPEFVNDQISENIRKAKCGDSDVGLNLLQEFIESTDHGQAINAYIAEALQKILNGADPREALNIKVFNRPEKDTEKRDLRINRIVQRRIDDGETLTSSLAYADDLAKRFARRKKQKSLNYTTIKTAYYRFNQDSLFKRLAKGQ